MYSQRQFTPGKKSNSAKIINYIAEYNARFGDYNNLECLCTNDIYDKTTLISGSSSVNTSNIRISRIINSSKGGTIQYGNFYLGEPLNVNYLGRTAGMPGGSGSPPVNKFN